VRKAFDRIIPDERFHMRLGQQIVDTYSHDEDDRARVLARVDRTFDLEQAGRVAYNRRMAQLGLADLDDATPPLP
jgi:hypothetical protein